MTPHISNHNATGAKGAPARIVHAPPSPAVRWALIALFLAALFVRVGVNAALQGIAGPPNPAFPDSILYAEAAASVAEGHYQVNGRPSMHAPPGIPILIAAARTVCLGSWLGPRLLYSL